MKRVSGGWTQGGITAGGEPTVSDTPSLNSQTGSTNDWWKFGVGRLYQAYNDGLYNDNGIRLSGGRKTFKSSEASTDRPYLLIAYNDQPDVPILHTPTVNKGFDTTRPTLKVQGLPEDPNDDDVLLNFQVTSVQGDWSSAVTSGWTNEESFQIPAGELTQGIQYWWRVRSADVCTPPDGLCDQDDAAGTHHPWPISEIRSFTIATKNLGADPRWAMWSEGIGNGMSLNVNESNGNLYLDAPIERIRNPLGFLSVGLAYNSQRDINDNTPGQGSGQQGLGEGWRLHVGPASSGLRLPIRLIEEEPSPYAGVTVEYRSGRTEEYPYRAGRTFANVGAGSAVITQNAAGEYLMRTPGGDEYTFDADGKLATAKPVSSKPRVVPGQERHYRYEFQADRLQNVYDALGRKAVSLTWSQLTAGWRVTKIKILPDELGGSGWWDLAYSSGTLSTVTNPEGDVVRFIDDDTCSGTALLAEIRNGEQSATKPGWRVAHFFDDISGDNYDICRVKKLFPPQDAGSNRHWLFEYGTGGAGYAAFTSMQTRVTDPRGTATASPLTDYRAQIDFNSQGLPIRLEAPKKSPGSEPDWVATMQWDANGNLLCSRSPQANAVRWGCTASSLTDSLSAVYDYENREEL